jgi:biopolymer transport protein ExbD
MPHAVTRHNLYARRPAPMGEMNVTPFIDVLLVLLIMLILAIPAPVQVTPVDLPSTDVPTLPVLDENTITIDAADRLSWNGTPVTAGDLRNGSRAAAALRSRRPRQLRYRRTHHRPDQGRRGGELRLYRE